MYQPFSHADVLDAPCYPRLYERLVGCDFDKGTWGKQ